MNYLNHEKMTGYIDHNYKNHNVRLHGTILAINESDMTAKMVFDNGFVSDGIPMETIQLDEGALSGLKKAANRAWGYIKDKFSVVNGMVRKVWNGITLNFNRAVNIGQLAANGGLPEGVGFYPSKEAYAEAQESGVEISEQEAPVASGADSNGFDEDAEFRKFWRNIFKDVIKFKNESNGKISGNALKKIYLDNAEKEYGPSMVESLKKNPMLNDFFGLPSTHDELMEGLSRDAAYQVLNEEEWADNGNLMSGYQSENIPNVSMKQVVQEIMLQLKAAYKAGEFNTSSEAGKKLLRNMQMQWANEKYEELLDNGMDEPTAKKKAVRFGLEMTKQMNKATNASKPVMIWGAPGIGKTSIIQQCRGMFKGATKGEGVDGNGYNINMLEVVLSKMTSDDFTLPSKGTDENTGEERAVNAIQSWIPCWQVSGDAQLDAIRDRAANLKMNTRKTLQDNGIDIADDIDTWRKNASSKMTLSNANTGDSYVTGNVDTRTRTDADNADVAQEINTIEQKRRGRPRKITEGLSFEDFDAEEEVMNNENSNNLTDGGIIFFDELTRAPKGVMNVIMNLINDRKVGEGWVLGSHWIIVCAGNRFWEMTGMDSTWEKAFGTRFQNMTFVPSYNDWKQWALGYNFDAATGRYSRERGPQRIDQEIIDFLDQARIDNHGDGSWYENVKDPDKDGDKSAKTYANPRSWQSASDAMVKYAREKHGRDGQVYLRDANGNYYINLTSEEKLEIIRNNIGLGSDSYQKFRMFKQTSAFTTQMKQNILNHGSLDNKGGVNKEIQSNGLKKLDISASLKNSYIPKVKGQFVNLEAITIRSLMQEIVSYIDWTKVTNTQLANVLSYFAVVCKIALPGGGGNVFEDMWKEIFHRLFIEYNKVHENVPKEVQEAMNDYILKGDKTKYIKWMAPAQEVWCFVYGWDGMDNSKTTVLTNALPKDKNDALHSPLDDGGNFEDDEV